MYTPSFLLPAQSCDHCDRDAVGRLTGGVVLTCGGLCRAMRWRALVTRPLPVGDLPSARPGQTWRCDYCRRRAVIKFGLDGDLRTPSHTCGRCRKAKRAARLEAAHEDAMRRCIDLRQQARSATTEAARSQTSDAADRAAAEASARLADLARL